MLASLSNLKSFITDTVSLYQRAMLDSRQLTQGDSTDARAREKSANDSLKSIEQPETGTELVRYRGNGQIVRLADVANTTHLQDIHQRAPTESLAKICNRLRLDLATESDVVDIVQALQLECGGILPALRSRSLGYNLQEGVIDHLRSVSKDLLKGKVPLASLQELFLGCESFIKESDRYGVTTPGTYNYTVQLVQNFAARQWSLHARQLQIEDSDPSHSQGLHLYSRWREIAVC